MADYLEFLESKTRRASDRGLADVSELAPHLFGFQQACVAHHLKIGAAGCFLDTGLGKTEVQLEFCQKAMEATNLTPILWTPLAVAAQTARRAEKWGYEAKVIRDQSEAKEGARHGRGDGGTARSQAQHRQARILTGSVAGVGIARLFPRTYLAFARLRSLYRGRTLAAKLVREVF